MLNKIVIVGLVKSDPVYIESEKEMYKDKGFCKFTIVNESDIPWRIKKDLPKERRGDVYIDCLASTHRGIKPGNYALEHVHSGDVVSIVGRIVASKHRVKEPGEGLRLDWVYGDYLCINVDEVRIERTKAERSRRIKSSYSENVYVLEDKEDKSEERNEIKDEELTFNL